MAHKEIHVAAAPVTVLVIGNGTTGNKLKINAAVRTILFNFILNGPASFGIPEVEQIA